MEDKGKEDVKNKQKVFSIIKIIWKIIEKILMIIIILISLIIVTQRISNNEKAFLGFRIFRVLTGSMIPKYQIGDVILVKEKQLDQITVGDDVTYTGTIGAMKGKMVTHQVINIETIDGQKAFHTKGIANNKEDPAVVYGGQINGVVQSKMYILTAICKGVTNRYILYFCMIVPLTIFIFFAFVKKNKKYE